MLPFFCFESPIMNKSRHQHPQQPVVGSSTALTSPVDNRVKSLIPDSFQGMTTIEVETSLRTLDDNIRDATNRIRALKPEDVTERERIEFKVMQAEKKMWMYLGGVAPIYSRGIVF